MSMIPGFGNALMPPGQEKESQAKIKRYMTIMDSMTDKELDSSNPKTFQVSISQCFALLSAHPNWCEGSFNVCPTSTMMQPGCTVS